MLERDVQDVRERVARIEALLEERIRVGEQHHQEYLARMQRIDDRDQRIEEMISRIPTSNDPNHLVKTGIGGAFLLAAGAFARAMGWY